MEEGALGCLRLKTRRVHGKCLPCYVDLAGDFRERHAVVFARWSARRSYLDAYTYMLLSLDEHRSHGRDQFSRSPVTYYRQYIFRDVRIASPRCLCCRKENTINRWILISCAPTTQTLKPEPIKRQVFVLIVFHYLP